MTKAQHTPGPWINNHQGAIEGCDRVICRVMDGYTTPTIKEAIANARLIAAGPDLLGALQECAEYLAEFFEEGREHRVVKLADAAITKAIAKAESSDD